MNLNDITANIRLRGNWEAIDLGFAMVQRWWKSIYPPLAILTMSIALVLFIVFPLDTLWVASLIFWWLKPLYDRLVLHIISNKLFNNDISTWQALSALPSLIWNTGFFQSMTFRRLSLSRGFNLPIWQLERLRGKQRAQRQSDLQLGAHSHAVWLTIGMIHIEMFLVLSLFTLVFIFLPENTQREFFLNLVNNKGDYEKWIDILNYIFYVSVVTFLHPYYIAGSFALYINRRTQLEAWDIELDFKRLSQRLKNTTKQLFSLFVATALSFLILTSPDQALAKEPSAEEVEVLSETRLPADKSKEIIRQVMQSKNLGEKKTVKRWVKIKKDDKLELPNNKLNDFFEPFAKLFSFIIEFGLWVLLGAGIILLIYFRDHWLHLLNIQNRKKKADYESPDVMFGMDVRPESLPDDIPGEARQLWKNDKQRESLSLLYRGALVQLINQESVQLQNSFTEGDVLRHSKTKISEKKQAYLNKLTQQWRLIAYAHRHPKQADMDILFNGWSSDFATVNNHSENFANNPANKPANNNTNGGHNE